VRLAAGAGIPVAAALCVALCACSPTRKEDLVGCKLQALRAFPREAVLRHSIGRRLTIETCMQTKGYTFNGREQGCNVSKDGALRETCYSR
jgi:hypothetical protein